MVFCDAWSRTLHSHHNTEETVYFPMLEEMCSQKGVLKRNHDEHERFLPALFAFDVYVSGVKDNGKEYDGSKIVGLVDGVGPALARHLESEISLLQSLEKDDQIDWDILGKAMAAHSKKAADRVCIAFACFIESNRETDLHLHRSEKFHFWLPIQMSLTKKVYMDLDFLLFLGSLVKSFGGFTYLNSRVPGVSLAVMIMGYRRSFPSSHINMKSWQLMLSLFFGARGD